MAGREVADGGQSRRADGHCCRRHRKPEQAGGLASLAPLIFLAPLISLNALAPLASVTPSLPPTFAPSHLRSLPPSLPPTFAPSRILPLSPFPTPTFSHSHSFPLPHSHTRTLSAGEQAASTAFVLNNTKFKQEGRFEMAYGALALFYGGLEALIGPPQMIDGSLIKSMEQV